MLQAVLFDYANTLVCFPPRRIIAQACYEADMPLYAQLASENGLDVQVLAPQLDEAITKQGDLAYQSPGLRNIDPVVIVREGAARLGLAPGDEWAAALVACEQRVMSELLQVASDALGTLKLLRQQGFRLGLVSNAFLPPALILGSLERFGLLEYLDAWVFSTDVGQRKPGRIIFEAILQKLEVAPDCAVMVGDELECDIAGAQALGCWTVQTLQFRQDQSHPARPHATIQSLAELPGILGEEKFPLFKTRRKLV